MVEHKNNVMVFLVLFAVKTGYFLSTDSLLGHHFLAEKKLERKKQEFRLSQAKGYPKTIVIHCLSEAIILQHHQIQSLKGSKGRMVAGFLGFCQAL